MNFVFCFSLLLLGALGWSSASEFVPAYLWQSSGSRGQIPALSHVNSDTFTELIIRKLADKNARIVVFAEENLSPEDFSSIDRSIFWSFTDLESKHSYLPSVQDPVEVLKNWNAQVMSVQDFHIGSIDSTNLIINLNDAKEDEDRVDMLYRHSKFIAKTYKKLLGDSDGDLLAIYTGYHSSWVLPKEIIKHRQTRSTDAVYTNDAKPLIEGNSMFYVSGPATISDGKKTENVTFTDLQVQDNKYTVKASNGELTFTVNETSGYWSVVDMKFGDIALNSDVYAPMQFSYHCSRMVFAKGNNVLTLPDFQIQHNATNKKFGDAYDCVGFTSIPIWSGLFVTLILVIILSMGLTMMMDIKTMDRFDDPKGKTIVVNATD